MALGMAVAGEGRVIFAWIVRPQSQAAAPPDFGEAALGESMRLIAVGSLLLLSVGCATTRVVHIDVGNGQRFVHESVAVDPVQVSEDAFKSALSRLVLDMRMDVAFRETDAVDQHEWSRSKSLLASSTGIVDSGTGSSLETLHSRICPDANDCLTLVGGTGLTFSRKDRTLMALSFALDTVWESVEAEVGAVLNPVALKAMVTSAALTLLLTLALPEPVTKVIAVALTAAMVAYLGVVPVWEIGRGFVRLWDDAGTAMSVIELQGIGHRFGRVLGRTAHVSWCSSSWRRSVERARWRPRGRNSRGFLKPRFAHSPRRDSSSGPP